MFPPFSNNGYDSAGIGECSGFPPGQQRRIFITHPRVEKVPLIAGCCRDRAWGLFSIRDNSCLLRVNRVFFNYIAPPECAFQADKRAMYAPAGFASLKALVSWNCGNHPRVRTTEGE
jgi:hypothetical protein